MFHPQPLSEAPSALQFSNLREDKKHEEMMGQIEKDNFLLRQVPAGWSGGSRRPGW